MRDALEFIHDLAFEHLPPEVVAQVRRCLLDIVGVAAAGSATTLSAIVRDHAARHLRGDTEHARLLFDGRAVSPAGAALANAATIDAMDGHDGHRLTKGHAGAAVLPAALAFLDAAPGATPHDLLTALVVGYEVANRCGIALHATAAAYHSSGAWNAVGAAAIGARALGLDRGRTGHALGIAEYHAPRAPMMHGIDHPTMVKDSSGWGAHVGVSAALLAGAGFTGPPASLLTAGEDGDLWGSLGHRWTVLEQYLKPYPVCRWAHPAVQAVVELVGRHDLAAEDVAHLEVTTFDPATRLVARQPATTEQAQYSLPFAVAVAAVRRALDPDLIARPEEADASIRRLAAGVQLRESTDMTAAFPARRLAAVTVVLTDGRRHRSGTTTAAGDPEVPLSDGDLRAKFRHLATPVLGDPAVERLLRHLDDLPDADLRTFLDTVFAPGG